MAVAETSSQKSLDPDPNKEQYLFLLEFFIHYMSGERLAKLNQTFLVPTSVSLQFLNIEEDDAVEITPVDSMFTPRAGAFVKDVENFYAGRSIVFAVPHNVVLNKNLEFKIKLKAYKKMPEINSDILIGNGELNLTREFCGLRKEMLQYWHRNVPPPKDYEGPVEFFYEEELAAVGLIFVTISAFGQSIVTEFDACNIEEDKKSFIFKGDESFDKSLAYNCRIISESLLNAYNESNEVNVKNEMKSDAMYYCSPCGYPSGANVIDLTDDSCKVFKDDLVLKNVGENNQPIQSSRGKFHQLCGKPVVLKVSGQLDEAGNINKPEVEVPSDDADHDIFVLRVGKKGIVGEGEKSDFQIEMKTPKGPDRRPPIRYETREMQTEVDEPNKTKPKAKGGMKKKKTKEKKKRKKK